MFWILALTAIVAIAAFVALAACALEGYEDKTGFHYKDKE